MGTDTSWERIGSGNAGLTELTDIHENNRNKYVQNEVEYKSQLGLMVTREWLEA
jgi:hypothetical protein